MAFSVQSTYGYRPACRDAPAVSIITPYYNTGPLFLDTIESVLRQSLQQWEWIVVNDGSDDPAALGALAPLRCADARIKVVDQPNRGLPLARNAGVAASSAPLLFFLDSDDLIHPTALEKLVWSLHSRPSSAFATAWHTTFGARHMAWPRGFDTRYAFLYENMVTPQTIIRRSVFDQVGGFARPEPGLDGLEDYELWLRCAANGFWGHDVREFLLSIRAKAPSEYTSYRWTFRERPEVLPAFRRRVRDRFPDLFRHGLPRPAAAGSPLDTHAVIPTELPFANCLERPEGQRRVLLLLPWVRTGGSDRFSLDLAAGLVARGDRVSVCLLRDVEHTWIDELQRVTGDVFNLAAFLAPADFPRFLHYLVQSRGITSVVTSNSLLAYQLLPYLRSRCPGVSFVDYLHMEEENWRSGGLPRAAIEHEELLDLHVVSSGHLREWMLARGAAPERVEVCHTNIDPAGWRPDPELRQRVRAELGVAGDTPLVLFVGRLVGQKRPRLAVEILRRLRDSGATFEAIIAGDGQDRGAVRRLLLRYGLRRQARMLGATPHSRVRELMAASDVLLLPSEQEGVALILFEALATGVVPVAADVGGQRELVSPEVGVLVPRGPGELEAYVDALARLVGQPELRAEMARAGRAHVVAHFTLDAMHSRMAALLDYSRRLADEAPRPAVGPGAGLAAATLAIEHFQLESRLRGFAPVRLALALRQSSAWGSVVRLAGLAALAEPLDRAIYAARRTLVERIRSALGKQK